MGYLDDIPTTPEEYRMEVRGTIQDYPELNHILLERDDDERELSDPELDRAIKRSLAKINQKPPRTVFTFENFFHDVYWTLIVDRAIVECLRMKGLLKMRNGMPYQDQGGPTIRLEGKDQKYLQTAQSLLQEWREEVNHFKKELSLEAAWGGVTSEFFYTNVRRR